MSENHKLRKDAAERIQRAGALYIQGKSFLEIKAAFDQDIHMATIKGYVRDYCKRNEISYNSTPHVSLAPAPFDLPAGSDDDDPTAPKDRRSNLYASKPADPFERQIDRLIESLY